jgi:hypothetical protein
MVPGRRKMPEMPTVHSRERLSDGVEQYDCVG